MWAKFRKMFGQKEDLAVLASLVALAGSYGKPLLDFLMPSDQLIVIISRDSARDRNPFPISRDKDSKALRLDPQLSMAFINNSPNYVLAKYIELLSPTIGTKRIGRGVCDVEKSWTLGMYKFILSEGDDPKDATAFSIAPGQIVSMRILFEGITDINGRDANIGKGIPICFHAELFDFKGRHHDFVTHIVDINKGDEESTEYTSKMEDKGMVALRFSPLWSLLH